MENMILDTVLLYIRHVSATVFIVGALMLLARSKDNRARRMLAMNMLLYGVIFLYALLSRICADTRILTYPAFNMLDPKLQFVRNVYIVIFFMFPLEVILPGWLTLKRFLRMLIPDGVLAVVYWIGVRIEGRGVESVQTYGAFVDHIHHFNVWFRWSFMLLAIVYICSLLKLISDHEQRYKQWCQDNYSNDDYRGISWMGLFVVAILASTFFYFILSFSGSEVALLAHNFIVTILYGGLLYKGLFYENPYPEGFFRKDTVLPSLRKVETAVETEVAESPKRKIDENMERFEAWMEKDRPYLFKDFKLADVSTVLHLKRSALSLLFNEGYGHSFHDIVRTYRLKDAKRLLVEDPALPIHKVAVYCGFSSSSSFIRSFVDVEGITPNRYRKEHI